MAKRAGAAVVMPVWPRLWQRRGERGPRGIPPGHLECTPLVRVDSADSRVGSTNAIAAQSRATYKQQQTIRFTIPRECAFGQVKIIIIIIIISRDYDRPAYSKNLQRHRRGRGRGVAGARAKASPQSARPSLRGAGGAVSAHLSTALAFTFFLIFSCLLSSALSPCWHVSARRGIAPHGHDFIDSSIRAIWPRITRRVHRAPVRQRAPRTPIGRASPRGS